LREISPTQGQSLTSIEISDEKKETQDKEKNVKEIFLKQGTG
jgi:hypothetical protein